MCLDTSALRPHLGGLLRVNRSGSLFRTTEVGSIGATAQRFGSTSRQKSRQPRDPSASWSVLSSWHVGAHQGQREGAFMRRSTVVLAASAAASLGASALVVTATDCGSSPVAEKSRAARAPESRLP